MTIALAHWRAVLAPLGIPTTDGRALHNPFALTFTAPAPLTVDTAEAVPTDGGGQLVIGRVDFATIDSGYPPYLVAAGTMRDVSGTLVDRMRSGDLIAAFDIAAALVTDDESPLTLRAATLTRVVARSARFALWPHAGRFEITTQQVAA